ncbi:hypothetical protein A1O3_02903 [Capronia epimyces CBS 606.96]|uniref:Protein artemis n=1 Tax=Capronia epimyces CBS 606.96 TaxID=1182542 RepID=W9YKV0_9EURO|nr:uncharacterized protein A1O3_02903 [Capronia epimyces CBS 606.96]EXJ89836.1 hypothetical protein A1O3_02903 [Capronia epimyces CBS 606.96]
MSTFNGIVKEFPNIRIDFFRTHPGKPPPAAYFLSHVHSDHLLGLESVKMPFVYCSATTRRILLKLEKYPHRINFAKGILESRKQHYRHLKTVLRPLPLHASTELELGPKSTIRVTLLDANHCPGAVMFLIEGDGKAIVYTGDIRAEPWWVNSIVQNPVILPYACGLKTLDCIYLDTTFASHDEPYREFPTKAEGLKELLEKVRQCPADTIFYFRAWTLGYEDVWIALSNLCKSRIHVDDYQFRIFRPGDEVGGDSYHNEGASLTGFTVGNHKLSGCLTAESNVRIHSCEPGTKCHSSIKGLKNIKWITPIISRLEDGTELREIGAGGGGGDLYQSSDLRLDDLTSIQQLAATCAELTDDEAVTTMLKDEVTRAHRLQRFSMTLEGVEDLHSGEKPLTLRDFLALLSKFHPSMHASRGQSVPRGRQRDAGDTIHFPYSRHSSYHELRHLIGVFRPKDICPCTVDLESWCEDLSMEALFGDLCVEKTFYYDEETRQQVEEWRERESLSSIRGRKRKRGDEETQETETQEDHQQVAVDESSQTNIDGPGVNTTKGSLSSSGDIVGHAQVEASEDSDGGRIQITLDDGSDDDCESLSMFDSIPGERLVIPVRKSAMKSSNDSPSQGSDCGEAPGDQEQLRRYARMEAYQAARHCLLRNDSSQWDDLCLRSVGRRGHEEEEIEL